MLLLQDIKIDKFQPIAIEQQRNIHPNLTKNRRCAIDMVPATEQIKTIEPLFALSAKILPNNISNV